MDFSTNTSLIVGLQQLQLLLVPQGNLLHLLHLEIDHTNARNEQCGSLSVKIQQQTRKDMIESDRNGIPSNSLSSPREPISLSEIIMEQSRAPRLIT